MGILLSTLIISLVLCLQSTLAHAWGGATHLEYASNMLGQLAVFAPLVKKLISKHTKHFLYGSIAADITLGKNHRGYMYNCHNWKVAFDLFEDKAKKDSQKTFMLGYMGHLAADTVSHNFFVPYKTIRSWNATLLKHVYWEMRMDMSVADEHWQLMSDLAAQDFSDDDSVLEDHLKKTLFSFKTNKKIFEGLIKFQRLKHYKKMVGLIANQNEWALSPEDTKNYKTLAQNAMLDFLKKMEHSFCLKADPTGKIKMHYAKDLVAQFKVLNQNKQLPVAKEQKILGQVKKHLQKHIYEVCTFPDTTDLASLL